MLNFFHSVIHRIRPAETSFNTSFIPRLGMDLLEASTNTTENLAIFEDWSSFSVEIKTDLVMAEFLMQVLNVTRQEAVACLTRNKQNLIKLLDRQSNKELEVIWEGFSPSQRRQISVALSIKKCIFANPLKSYEELVAQAINWFHQEPAPAVFIEEVRFYQLREILNSWVNWEKVKQQLPGPLESLKLVLMHYNRPFPSDFFSQAFDIDRFPNARFLYEAALLFKQSQSTDMFEGLENNGTLSFFLLEQYYLSVLSEDWHKQKIIDQLFSKASVGNDTQAIYFNGLAFKQAAGKSFEDLINSEQLEKNPEYRMLSISQQTCLLKEKFKQIGESTQYKIGSLQHSLASIVNRILDYQYSLSRVPFRDLDELILVFRQIEEKWAIEKNYPIQPRLLLSLHLAESNNVIIPGDDWKAKVKNYLIYLSSEFEKLFLSPPRFDRIEAAEKLLAERFGMDTKMIHTGRYYVIEADDFNLSQTYFGSPLEEFLKIADWDGLVGRRMYFEKKVIEPREALRAAEETFNANLYQDHWIQNKAKSNLNKPMAAANDTDIEQEAKRIAANYMAEFESHRAWVRGLETWVSTIPIIGPLYTIEEGIRDKDPTEIICGIVFLGLDAFDLLFRSEAEVDIESGNLRKSLSIRERMTVDNVDSTFRKLNLPVSDLPLDDNIIFSDPFFELEKNSVVPFSHRSLAEQVRAGEQGLKWNEYELIYLRAEDRVVPVKPQGGYFREVNWQSGEVDLKKHLIFQDPISKNYYSGGGLKGGSPDAIELSETELKQRETVKKTEMIFADASDAITYNFDNLFEQCFFVTRESVSAFNALEFYRLLYTNSPSFRRIFNRYHETFVSEGATIRWEISIHANTVSRADFATYTLHIAPDAEISKLYYVGNNNLESSRPEQIYLHEILHALTGHVDPIKAISMRHRGPIVYLTDKILSEAGYVFPQQIMYRRLSNQVEIRDFSIKENSQWNQFRENAKLLALQENNYLDNMIDKQVKLSAYKKVFGEELAERYTVKESQLILDKINAQPEFNSQYNFIEQYEMLFKSMDSETHLGIKNFYRSFYQYSETFSKLFDSWYAQIKNLPIQTWQFEIDNPASLSELPSNKRVHCINDRTRKIYIFDDKTLYLSDKGLRPIERTRQLLHEMVQILTDLNDLPPSLALKNRGAVVQITDRIFQEAKLSFPKRLAYMLALSDDLETQSLLRNYQLEAGRAALLEDRIIEEARSQDGVSCIPFCQKKRSLEKKAFPRLADKKNKHRALFSSIPENIEETMDMIKNKLERQGIGTLKQIGLANQSLKDTSPLFFKNNFLVANESNFTSNPVNLTLLN